MELLQGFFQQTLYGYFNPQKLILIEKYNSLYKHLITVRKNDISWRGYQFHFLPLDFIPGGGSLSGSCYKAFTSKETWSNSEAKCRRLGAQLVKIESAEENDYLVKTFLTASAGTYWIGLSDQVKEDEWIWTDRSLLVNYTNWANDNPNNLHGKQHCGHIAKGSFHLLGYEFTGFNGEWNDLECDVQLEFICEQFSP